jgi:hypothetical protein
VGHQIERAELVQAENDHQLTVVGTTSPSAIAYRCPTRAFFAS